MPTTIPLVPRDVSIGLVRGAAASTPSLDFVIVVTISVIGLLLTVGFARLFPLSADVAALMSSVS
jgi:hypothetical protein